MTSREVSHHQTTATIKIETPIGRRMAVQRITVASRRKPERAEDASSQGNQIRIVSMTRIWLVEAEFGLDPRRPVAEDDDARRKQQGLFDVVGDEEGREAVAL